MSGAPRSTAAAERAHRATEGGSSFRTSREGGGESGLQGPKPIIWSGIGVLSLGFYIPSSAASGVALQGFVHSFCA